MTEPLVVMNAPFDLTLLDRELRRHRASSLDSWFESTTLRVLDPRVLDKHLEILREILPLHRQLADSGQVELTTTPYYHPILPLLFDKKLAREAMPDVKLPHYTGGYPEDAAVHVQRALELHGQVFGAAPRGLWPARSEVDDLALMRAEHPVLLAVKKDGKVSV